MYISVWCHLSQLHCADFFMSNSSHRLPCSTILHRQLGTILSPFLHNHFAISTIVRRHLASSPVIHSHLIALFSMHRNLITSFIVHRILSLHSLCIAFYHFIHRASHLITSFTVHRISSLHSSCIAISSRFYRRWCHQGLNIPPYIKLILISLWFT